MWLFLWPIAFCLETVSRQDGEVPKNSHPIFHLIGRIVLLPGVLRLVLRVLFLAPRGVQKNHQEERQPSTWLSLFFLFHSSARPALFMTVLPQQHGKHLPDGYGGQPRSTSSSNGV